MILLPAVDILGGKAVRLRQGDFAASTTYDADPLDAARRWVAQGARALHVVDLDGARTGVPRNLDHLRRIARELEVPVQFGGGLRDAAAVAGALSAGAARAVLGTAAYGERGMLDAVLAAHGDRVVVSVDARDGRVAAAGWTEQTELDAQALIARLRERGVRRFIYSSIERDGTLTGPDLERARRVGRAAQGAVIYSGGISSLGDLRALRELELEGVIVGKALYEGRFEVGEAQEALCTTNG